MHRWWTFAKRGWVSTKPGTEPGYLSDFTVKTPKLQREVAEFLGCVRKYDQFLGQVLEAINAVGLRETTIIVHTTDHGVALPGSKGLLYGPGCHTHMIYSGPGILKGQIRDALVSSIDFAPTIAALCGVSLPSQFHGQSYDQLLTNTSAPDQGRVQIFTETTFADIYHPIRAVHTPEWRYIRNYCDFPVVQGPPVDIRSGKGFNEWIKAVTPYGWADRRPPEELYDLRADPLCRSNLLLIQPAHPKLGEFRKILDDHLVATSDPILLGPYPAPPGARLDNAAAFPHLVGAKSSAEFTSRSR